MSVLTIDLLPMAVSQGGPSVGPAGPQQMRVKPGEQIEIDLLLDSCCVLRGPRSGDMSDLTASLPACRGAAPVRCPSRR